MYLTIEFPMVYNDEDNVPFSIVFFTDDDFTLNNLTNRSLNSSENASINNRQSVNNNSSTNIQKSNNEDPELGLDNLCELKHHMLTRNARANNTDRRLQPNSLTRNALETIINVNFL